MILCLLLGCCSCGSFKKTEIIASAPPLLQQNEMPESTVGMEIFLIRIAPQQQELVRSLWQEVDEQMVAPLLRHDLHEQGIRVGIQGSYLSPTLSNLINVTAERLNQDGPDKVNEVAVADIRLDPEVSRQFRNLLPGMRAVLKPFDDTLPEMSLFWMESGHICGKTYKDASGMISITVQIQPNGMVRFEVVPELEYGMPETRIRHHHGVFMQENGKPRKIFDSLALSLNLLPGQWIVLGPTGSGNSNLGRALFHRGEERNEQKIIAVRLVRMKMETPTGQNRPPAATMDASLPERM